MPNTKLSSVNYDIIYGGKKVCAKCHVNAYGKATSLGKEEDIKMLGKEVTSEPLERKLGIPKQMYWIHSHYF